MIAMTAMIDPTGLITVVVGAVALAAVLIHVALAVGVMFDAVNLERHRRLWFLGAMTWALATLVTGLFGATAYWLMHRSAIAGDPPKQ
jgi:hypothetical protein